MKKFRAKVKELNIWLKQIRNLIPAKEWWQILKAKVTTHPNFNQYNQEKTIQKVYLKTLKILSL